MDPVTAIGVASAAISFMDYTIKVCKTFHEVKSSMDGFTKENSDIKEAEETCKNMLEQLNEKRSKAARSQLGSGLDRSIGKSIDASQKLMDLLDHIKKKRHAKILGSLSALYLTLRNQGKIKELLSALVTSIQALETSQKGFASLDEQGVAILQALSTGEDRERNLFHCLDNFQQQTKQTLQRLKSEVESGNMTDDRIEQKLDDLLQRYQPDRKKDFVDGFFFRDYQAREKDISGPRPGTYDWIFDRAAGEVTEAVELQKKATWPSFPRWLEDAQSSTQYWLSGKAGSGKSTLMAYMIREDLEGSRTRQHLQVWSGSRSLHVLSFFLYRPKQEVQAGLEYLLRSLLYQLLKKVPEMQEILMSEFMDSELDSKIPVWPVNTLKAMLEFALNTAEDCAFFIFIDGVDEFQDFQNPNEESTTAFDLVNLLYSFQKPENVKLCISSRPELAIRERHSSFFEAKLSDLNWNDICVFVEGQLGPIPYREYIKKEICTRANGIFMWAVFAVKQMNEGDSSGLGYQKLLDRLDEMGRGLQTAISSMLKGLLKHQRAALAFYLHALGSWRETQMREPITVALLAASRLQGDGLGVESYEAFTGLCEQEDLAIQACSRGLFEVKSQANTSRWRSTAEDVLVNMKLESCTKRHSSFKERIDELKMDSWKTIKNEEHFRRVIGYGLRNVSWIHRSAYDFFFAAEEPSAALKILLESADSSKVFKQIAQGMMRLCRFQPVEYSSKIKSLAWERALRNTTLERTSQVISYIGQVALPEGEVAQGYHELLCTTRLELLHTWGFEAPVKSRGHIPGDFFSSKLLDDCLQMSDEDLCRDMDLQAAEKMLRSVVMLETGLLGQVGNRRGFRKAEHYLRNRFATLHKHHFGRLILAETPRSLEFGSASPQYQTMVMDTIQSWSDRLGRDHFARVPVLSPTLRFLTCYNLQDFLSSQQSESPRLSAIHEMPHIHFQWTPLCSNESMNWYVNDMLQYLIAGIKYRHAAASRDILERIIHVAKPWGVWVVSKVKCEAVKDIPLAEKKTPCQNHSTRIFTTFEHLCTSDIIYRQYRDPTPLDCLSYRLVHFCRNAEGCLEVLFEHEGHLSGLLSTDQSDRKPLYDIGTNPQSWQATTIIEDVRKSASLDDRQKNILIRYIGTWQLQERK